MASRPQKTVFVKNLSLQTTDNEFEEAFTKFGTIKKAFIVKDKNGSQSKGFGYIIFGKEDDCKKCIKSKVELQGKNLKISIAKPKLRPDKNKIQPEKNVEDENDDDEDKKDDESDEDKEDDESDEDKEDDESDEDKEDDESDEDKEDDESDEDKEDDENEEDANDDEDNDDEDDDEDNDDVKSSKKFCKIMKEIQKAKEQEKDDDDASNSGDEKMEVDNDDEEGDDDEEEGDDDKEDDDDEEEGDDDDEPSKKKRKVERQINENDAEEGKTIFVRNLSFDSVEDDLEEFFEEFGDLHYCRIVIDKKSERSRGVAFVRFRAKEDAEKCLKEYETNPVKFSITGRRLNLMVAVTKVEAKNKFENQVREEEGSKRNLHLIRTTMIRAGTKAAEGMSKEDLQMRETILASTKEKLKNPNIFVSPVRLCIRNIPFEVDDKRLKTAFLKAAGGGKEVKVTESRIMRDNTKPRSNGRQCMSKGFGFVTFTLHDHALAAAMATNNATIFGEHKRLIVEFSLENKAVYELRQKRLEKSRQNVNIPRDQRNFKKDKTDKKFQIQRVPKTKPGQKDLPSHLGPKIRHKNRGNQDKNKKQQFKKQQFKKQQHENKGKDDIKRHNKRKRSSVREVSDNVDAMVRKRKMERPSRD